MIEKTATQVEKATSDAVDKTRRIVETGIRKVWSILDAASEKPPPSEYLSKQAVRAIQGIRKSS